MARNLTTDDVVDTSTRPTASSLGATDSILTYDDINKIIKKSAPSVLKTAMDIDGVTSTAITGLINDITALNNPTEQKTENGYVTLPSGIIIQWGYKSNIPNDARVVVNFQTAFSNLCFGVQTTPTSIGTGGPDNIDNRFDIVGLSLVDFEVLSQNVGGAVGNKSFYWFAIGW